MTRKLILTVLIAHIGFSLYMWFIPILSFRPWLFGELLALIYAITCLIFGVALLVLSLIGWVVEIKKVVACAWLICLPLFVVTWGMLSLAPYLPFALAFEASRGALDRLAVDILANPESFRQRSWFFAGPFRFGSFDILGNDVVVLRMGQRGRSGYNKGFVRVREGVQLGTNWLAIPSESKGLYITSIPALNGTGHPWYGMLATLGGFVKPVSSIGRGGNPLKIDQLPTAILGTWNGYSEASIGEPATEWNGQWEFKPNNVAVFDAKPDYRYGIKGNTLSISVDEGLGIWSKGTRIGQAGSLYGRSKIEIVGKWLVVSGPEPPKNYTYEYVLERVALRDGS